MAIRAIRVFLPLITVSIIAASCVGEEPTEGTGRSTSAQTASPDDGTCTHPLCEEGDALDSACASCASSICAADPFCCGTEWDAICVSAVETVCNASCDEPPVCEHDVCDAGSPLERACDDCAASICAADPYCCSVQWDGICVGEVSSVCGQTCEPPPPECAHNPCDTGDALDDTCDPCVSSICAADPFCCNNQWDRICVDEVQAVCGLSCTPPDECAHDVCDTGVALNAGCDECVANICAADPYCCNTAWDSICVGQADTVCGNQTAVAPVDILFLVDNSCSMADEQANLAANFPALLAAVQSQGADFHIGVTTTDVSSTGEQGALVGATKIITPSTPNPDMVFESNVLVGTMGDPMEQGLEASRLALSAPMINGANSGFLRPDAGLVIVYLSDENDQSPDATSDYLSFIEGLKDPASGLPVTVNAIIGDGGPGSCWADDGVRYESLVTATAGVVSHICDTDWSAALTNIPNTTVSGCGP